MLTVRQRIALWFVGLSTLVYVTPTILGCVFFYYSLTSALDHELKTLTSSLGHAIDLQGERPHFREWARVVQTDPARALCAIQLYDDQGKLLERYGIEGISRLIRDRQEIYENGLKMRLRVTPLISHGHNVGYLQIEISAKERDAATKHFALTMALIAPAVLLGLGICSLLVSDKATVPIRQTIDLLRQFMADAGHELNTPLSIIDASAQAMEHKLAKQGISMKETSVIAGSAERMQKIIDALMLLAELQTPVKQVARKPVSMVEIVTHCINDFSVKFEQKEVTLKHSSIPDLCVMGDRDALVTMLDNLLDNALSYTDTAGSVSVSVTQEGGSIILTVSDTGIGIPKDSLPFVFDRFYRVDKSRSRNSGGSGLGLSIAKGIANAHNGTIQVTSKEGEGTKFTVSLPVHI